MKVTRKRAPLALAGAAVAAALVALPATAAADESKAQLIPHAYDGPEIDGLFNDWPGGYLPTEPNQLDNQGMFQAQYNCRTGMLSVAVRNGHVGIPVAVQQLGVSDPVPYPYVPAKVEVEKLPSSPPVPDATYSGENADFHVGRNEPGYEMRFPLGEGAYKLHYTAPGSEVVNSGDVSENPLPRPASGYAYIRIKCPTIRIDKTAMGTYNELYDWTVHKTASVVDKKSADGKSTTVKYDIDVKRTGPKRIDRDVRGTIKIYNDGHIPVPTIRVADLGTGLRDACRIHGVRVGKGIDYKKRDNYVVFEGLYPKQHAEIDYICHPNPDIPFAKWSKKPANKAVVAWAPVREVRPEVEQAGGETRPEGPKNVNGVRTYFEWDQKLNNTYLGRALVFDREAVKGEKSKDPKAGLLGIATDDWSHSYTRQLALPAKGECRTHTNTAVLRNPGAKAWNPTSTAKVEICRDKDGTVKAVASNPAKPSRDKQTGRRCHVNLRTDIRGARVIRQRGSMLKMRIRTRGKHSAGRVRTRLVVPKGLRIVGVRGIARKAVKIRGRVIIVNHKWIPRGRGRTILVKVKPTKRSRVINRGVIRAMSKHRCDVDRDRKRVVWRGPRPQPPTNGDGGDTAE